MKSICNSLTAVICCSLLLASGNGRAQEKFRVCADPLNPPYSTREQTGYENKIAQLFAEQLGQELEYFWFPQRIGFIRNTLNSEIEHTDQYRCDVVIGVPSGFDFAKTTKPYFHSTYVLLVAKGRGWDDISDAEQLAKLPLQRKEALKIAMFDRGPGTAWLQKQGLLDQGIPYQSMTGDDKNNVAMQIEKDLKAGVIDMVILWGPMAGYITSQSPKDSYAMIPMRSTLGLKFDFSMAMAVRYGDDNRLKLLNGLIDNNRERIREIVKGYHIPVLSIPEHVRQEDDDD